MTFVDVPGLCRALATEYPVQPGGPHPPKVSPRVYNPTVFSAYPGGRPMDAHIPGQLLHYAPMQVRDRIKLPLS
ncbi:uncharacterized protein RCC_11222 [Ramularia collo-cygni]|uniref:Uncharacterized protein n=1 Tax=Ramularia collo-cygni TaxID=112498 RepID=A0A2D3VED9_9PEZI|nr:uncharacterized protein RCC_11222 [Ramularia collo-cygni]CZT25490.1 uncharacterized protein RCC_11222 [Ramularia collo-cygni]